MIWIQQQRESTLDTYYISGLPLNFSNKSDFMVSIQNLNNKDIHRIETCELIEAEFNVNQHDVIPDIADAIISIFEQMAQLNFENNQLETLQDNSDLMTMALTNLDSDPIENGVTASRTYDYQTYNKQKRQFHLSFIIYSAISTHIEVDFKKTGKSDQEKATYVKKYKKIITNNVIQKLIFDQRFKCSYSHVDLSIQNNAQRFSFERINNSKPHFGPEGDVDNIVFICRIFNSAAGMNRRKMLQVFLSQSHIPLSEKVREAATLEYNQLCKVQPTKTGPVSIPDCVVPIQMTMDDIELQTPPQSDETVTQESEYILL